MASYMSYKAKNAANEELKYGRNYELWAGRKIITLTVRKIDWHVLWGFKILHGITVKDGSFSEHKKTDNGWDRETLDRANEASGRKLTKTRTYKTLATKMEGKRSQRTLNHAWTLWCECKLIFFYNWPCFKSLPQFKHLEVFESFTRVSLRLQWF